MPRTRTVYMRKGKMKKFLKRSKKDIIQDTPAKITNETVAEHRERVLAGGRKFKYPVQYQRHKLIRNTVLISVGALILLIVLGWHQLYVAQNSSKLFYRITQLVPVPVASVNGEQVRYSDYLMRYRSSVYYLQQQNTLNLNSKDGKRQSEFVKRQEMDRAEKNAYVRQLARKHGIKVSDEEVMNFIKRDTDSRSVSLNAYEKTVLLTFYDWSLDEYKSVVKDELLKRKVRLTVDVTARKRIEDLQQQVIGGADMATVATASSEDETTKANGGDSGELSLKSQDPHGLIAAAQKLQKDQVSPLIQGVDAYYFIKLIDKNDKMVHFRLVSVKLTQFDKDFAQLRKDNKINEYITINEQTENR